MDSLIKIYLQRAEDEFILAQKDMEISLNQKTKEFLGIPKDKSTGHKHLI
ncbi:MAG: hypothetical protein KKF46_07310 [Nanoarchaeota archaeon]|nr:hypothetical protein [Nanoarchaeota archaeon]MBU1322136.1 hypothetical protein [Nanoarchaeota archaeon]MBU1597604.1 hypothetical protein [Nanoarchaeota archaeon]MBU2442096.1 hypothetical protein [Nanoarchaeota archaeon]